MASQTVAYERRDNVGLVTLDRPHRLNAINAALLADLVRQLDFAREDPQVVSVVLAGAGRAFCAGADLKEAAEGKDWAGEVAGLQEVQRAIMRLGKPLIAAVHGYALGGGCEFAMSCDIRVAAEDAVFGFPETEVGMTLTTAGTKLLAQLVGLGKAKELVFTGDYIDAHEALRLSLVNKVVQRHRLLTETVALAGHIAERSPLALRLSREAIDQGLHSSFEDTLQLETTHLMECVHDQNHRSLVDQKLAEMKRR